MTKHCLVFGDFDFPNINWYNLSAPGKSGDAEFEFLESIIDCLSWQHNIML